MKKMFTLLLCFALLLSLTGCCLKHEWEDATCEDPKTCSKCGETEGEPLDHEWERATCQNPKTCQLCGETKGEPRDHDWTEAGCEDAAVCLDCGRTQGEPAGHDIFNIPLDSGCWNGTCPTCGEALSGEVDWEFYGPKILEGTLMTTGIMSNGIHTTDEGDYITFHADGTLEAHILSDDMTGTWAFDQYQFGLLYYTATMADNPYTISFPHTDFNSCMMDADEADLIIFFEDRF